MAGILLQPLSGLQLAHAVQKHQIFHVAAAHPGNELFVLDATNAAPGVQVGAVQNQHFLGAAALRVCRKAAFHGAGQRGKARFVIVPPLHQPPHGPQSPLARKQHIALARLLGITAGALGDDQAAQKPLLVDGIGQTIQIFLAALNITVVVFLMEGDQLHRDHLLTLRGEIGCRADGHAAHLPGAGKACIGVFLFFKLFQCHVPPSILAFSSSYSAT